MTNFPQVNFIGNKFKLAPWIVKNLPLDIDTVFDAFSGGASTSYEFKKHGLKVISNDIMLTNFLIAKALIENQNQILSSDNLSKILNSKPKAGFAYKEYSNKLFYSDECKELDGILKTIESIRDPYEKALALTLVRRAMIRKMPYSRFNLNWEKIKQLRDEEYSYAKYGRRRAYHNKSFKEHLLDNHISYNGAVFDNKKNNKALNKNIFDAIKCVNADLIYLDPPYSGTMNNYFGFYGALDEILTNKKLEPFEDNFVNKNNSIKLFEKLFLKLNKYNYWVLSYNNSSYPDKKSLETLLKQYSTKVKVIEKKHNYQITGKANKNKNKEYLFIVDNRR